jgi:class 3 adenylate cyclase
MSAAPVIAPIQVPNTADEVARRTAILDAVGYAATKIVAGTDWRAGIQELLQRLGLAMGVSRVSLFEMHAGPDGALVESCRYDWAEPGLALMSNDPRCQNILLADADTGALVDDWTLRRQRGEVIQATRSEVSGYTRQVYDEQGTQSFLSVPVLVDGRYWGFLGFDDCRHERSWSNLETDVLKTAAALIAGAIHQAEARAHLKASEERYALAARGADAGLWEWDIASGKHYFAPRLYEILGLDPEGPAITLDAMCQKLRPATHANLKEALKDRAARRKRRFEFECELVDETGHPTGPWIVVRGMILYEDVSVQRLVGSVRDITERKHMERKLAEVEGKRAQLARHFSANMIEDILDGGTNLETVRQQQVAVLFTDLFNFTAMTAAMPGPEVIRLLRELHGLIEEAVFVNGGTLDKYIGDGVMATFGTPRPGPRDASNALASARAMVAGIVRRNARSENRGRPPLRIGVGLHYGEVTLGNVGTERRMELTVVGNTVNVASRLEGLTRKLGRAIIASDSLLAQARREGGEDALAGFTDLGSQIIRGQTAPIRLWGFAATA